MAYSGYYEFTIKQIDYGKQEISEFDDETLFINIYHFWCFSKYLSPYFLIELIKNEFQTINPCDYLFPSEDYFIKLLSLKTDLDKLIKKRHLPKTI